MTGREVTRLEGFSDAVFGCALTLLVVSLEVPEDFPALKQTLSGFLPFAATFTVVGWIWFEHCLWNAQRQRERFGLGPVQGTNGYRTGVARARLEASLT